MPPEGIRAPVVKGRCGGRISGYATAGTWVECPPFHFEPEFPPGQGRSVFSRRPHQRMQRKAVRGGNGRKLTAPPSGRDYLLQLFRVSILTILSEPLPHTLIYGWALVSCSKGPICFASYSLPLFLSYAIFSPILSLLLSRTLTHLWIITIIIEPPQNFGDASPPIKTGSTCSPIQDGFFEPFINMQLFWKALLPLWIYRLCIYFRGSYKGKHARWFYWRTKTLG